MFIDTFNIFGILIVLSLLAAVVWSGLRCVHALHMFQLDSYINLRLFKWLWAEPQRRLIEAWSGLLCIGLFGGLWLLWALGVEQGAYLILGVWCIASTLLLLRSKQPKAKKALVYTARAVRILTVALLIVIGVAGTVGLYAFEQVSQGRLPFAEYKTAAFILIGGAAIIQLAPLAVIFANLLLVPIQKTINTFYLFSAKSRLRQFGPIVVGITGSYGKTSTKYFLHTLLSERYRTLKTPESFNTLMGVCRVINNDLQPQHEVFIVEMGAYSRGVIRELADFVHPQIGILTAIGPQHLERFKTIENIAAAKYELIESLPNSGVAVFNNDDQRCRGLAGRTDRVKVLRYGVDSSQSGLNVWAEGIKQDVHGLSFALVDSEGNRAATHTMLMGRHNVLNLLGAACVAREMGLSLEDIAKAIAKIQPVPHRLQLLHGAGGVTVIDDSYNSNPIGAIEALEVLREFKTGKHILVTPGMVELGEVEAAQNEEFGARAASVCDYVLLVGPKQTLAIMRGLEREQFPRERVYVVRDLTEATSKLQQIVQTGDVVLFENDLPDLYVEA
jgi:UDP-N-acetylmuramoyl-tripeptide--D-alanyl-D-alanine ligase